jgi:GNAT superfamily N-acetyltransferase
LSENKILLYEELSQNAHPSLQTQLFDGWVLRYAQGFESGRLNSISPLYPSSIDLSEKIIECEKRYFALGQATLFKLTDAADPKLEKAIIERGYEIKMPTNVMELSICEREFSSGDCVVSEHADEKWLREFEKFSHKKSLAQIFANIKSPAIFARVEKNTSTVACGSAVIERGYMGLMNVMVDENERGKGYGEELCLSLLHAAKARGAHTAYLQVEQANEKARNLYTKLGYKTVYSYWYRVKSN